MTIVEACLPPTSLLTGQNHHYADGFKSVLNRKFEDLSITAIGKAFFSGGPKWIGVLFDLRNRIVSLIGLKTPGGLKDRRSQLDQFQCEPGERLGLFSVYHKTENEVILGEDDRHLNFRVSLFLNAHPSHQNNSELTITTTVTFHNWFGRLYFFPVKPLHRIIVPAMLKSIINQVEARSE